MKVILLVAHFCFFLLLVIPLIGQNIDFTLKYNQSTSEYEVYARSDSSNFNFSVGGGSQLTMVFPASILDTAFTVTTVNGGQWSDNSRVFAPTADSANDFHAIASNGSPITLVAGQELLLFTFTIPGTACLEGARIFENSSDPQSSDTGMNGGDYNNYFVDLNTFLDSYNGNYDNNGNLSCASCTAESGVLSY